ncbi:MAG: hypothetical protein MZW92_51630 [Comamonadaceae bacterium]|nr:hypothetical protein [Comamonadaceae bacterium]
MFRHPSGFAPDSLDQPIAALDALPRGTVAARHRQCHRQAAATAGRHRCAAACPARRHPAAAMVVAGRRACWPRFGRRSSPSTCPATACARRTSPRRYCAACCGTPTASWTTAIRRDDEPQAVQRAARKFHDDWRRTTGEMDELVEVFGDLGDALQLHRWDATRGRLHGTGWQEVLRIRRLLEQLPEMCAVIRRLGRSRTTDEADESREMEIAIVDETTALVLQQRRNWPSPTCRARRGASSARAASRACCRARPCCCGTPSCA